MGVYEGLYLSVFAGEDVRELVLTLENSETESGTYEKVVEYPSKTVEYGELILKEPLPFRLKNWIRLKLSKEAKIYGFLSVGVDKGVVIDD